MYNRSCGELSSTHERDKLAELLDKHKSTFAVSPNDLGRTSLIQHAIDTGTASPIKQRPRRPPRAFVDEEEEIIQTQLRSGVIRESTSAWSSPLVYVRKRDGSTRPCVDYRKLNEVTTKDAYPLPRIEDCLDCIGGAKIFSTLDLQSGYWQIELKEEDQQKTAFSTRSGHYEYITMPFGLCNAPSTFERGMELLMKGLQWKTLILYLDDIIVLGSTFEEHLERLNEVLSRLGQAGLKLKPSKCNLVKSEVCYLGHVVSAKGIKPDPDKIDRIHQWPTPKTVSDVRSFIGLCSYYRRFIRGFSSIASPLTRLMEKSRTFEWDSECQSAFDELKLAITSDNCMAYPNDEGMFILDTDASATGVGAVLSQLQWDESAQCELERPVAFASRSLTKTQRRYCTTRRELLAVVSFVCHFRHFLFGRKFLIRTDHSSLRWIMSFREPTDQMARWIERLSQFDFVIEHREGRKHGNADALSRIACDPDTCDCYDKSSILEKLPCGGCKTCERRHREWSDFFEEDDIIPLSARSIRPTQKPASHIQADASCQTTPISSHQGRGPEVKKGLYVMIVFVIAFFMSLISSITRCRTLWGIMIVCILGILAVFWQDVVHGGYVMNGAVLSFGGGLWSIPSRLARVNRASTSQKKVPPDKRGNDVNNDGQSDFVSGGRPELQGVIIGNLTREELITMQKNDPNVAIVLDWLTKSPDRPARNLVQDKSPTVRNLWLSWQQLQIVDGLLYKRHDTNSKLTTRLQLVVPEKLQDRVIEANHASIFAGHLGAKKTLSRISRSFFWLNMNEAVRLFIANCVICGARKRPTSKPRAPLGEYNVGHPMDRIAIDIMGPLPVSDNGNRYVMVVGDTFTKWIEAYAIPDQTAETVAEKLVNEFISRFGTPLELHSDQGRTFESNLFQDVCKLLGITKTRTTPYHPSSNGMIERFNLTLANMISSFVDKNQKDWDKNLPLLTAGYRSSTHETIGFSPNFLMLGREVRTPLEFSLDIDPIDEEPSDIGGYANRMAKTMKQSWKLARDNIGRSTSRQKRNYDLRTSVNNYEVATT